MLKKIFKKLKSYKKYKMEWVLKVFLKYSIYKNDRVRIEIITDYSDLLKFSKEELKQLTRININAF